VGKFFSTWFNALSAEQKAHVPEKLKELKGTRTIILLHEGLPIAGIQLTGRSKSIVSFMQTFKPKMAVAFLKEHGITPAEELFVHALSKLRLTKLTNTTLTPSGAKLWNRFGKKHAVNGVKTKKIVLTFPENFLEKVKPVTEFKE
jgi:hypothetical protein